jgi:hypothetical protein
VSDLVAAGYARRGRGHRESGEGGEEESPCCQGGGLGGKVGLGNAMVI